MMHIYGIEFICQISKAMDDKKNYKTGDLITLEYNHDFCCVE